ncbi:hypothetical protein ACP275_12G069200 [Erythranthe tilingii]
MDFLANNNNNNNNSANLELTIAPPDFSSSPISFPYSSGGSGGAMKEVDINQVPSSGTEEECMQEEEEEDESPNGGPGPRKKLRLTKEQKKKESLAIELKLKPRQVEVWFQNRRARSKTKKTEMEYEYLKRCFGTLTEQNRRLQNEVEELRIIKVVPPLCRQQLTLTMCPRCERVSTPTTSLTTTTTAATVAAKWIFHQQRRQP